MNEKFFFPGNFGKICGILNTDAESKETAIIIHGYTSNKDSSAKAIAKALNSIGINTLRLDLDNQGESDLDFTTEANIPNYVEQISASILFLKSKKLSTIHLAGTSFGGTIAIYSALKHPEIQKIFLRAPVLDWDFHKDSNKNKRNHLSTQDANSIYQKMMIIHGTEDKSVDYKISEKMVKYFPNAVLHIIENANHDLAINGNYRMGIKLMKDFFAT